MDLRIEIDLHQEIVMLSLHIVGIKLQIYFSYV